MENPGESSLRIKISIDRDEMTTKANCPNLSTTISSVNEQQAQFDVVNHKLPLLYRSTGKDRDSQNLGQRNKQIITDEKSEDLDVNRQTISISEP